MDIETVYEKLVALSQEIGLPECYKNDLLVHDRHKLKTEQPEEFYWVARTCGTHLYTPEELRKYSGLLSPGGIGDFQVRWFHCINGEIQPVTREEVREKVLFSRVSQ